MRSWANGEIFNSGGNNSETLEWRLDCELSSDTDATQLKSPSDMSTSSDLKNGVEDGGEPQSITNKVTPKE